MTAITPFCMSATPFTLAGDLDEVALRLHLRRVIAEGVGIKLGSGGAGEGNALSASEMRRIYEIGVEECKGKVPVYANPPEPRTTQAMIENALIAVDAGVDVVQVYSVDGGHGMRPTEQEQIAYYDEILARIDHPVAISVHPIVGHVPSSAFVTGLCKRYEQIVCVNLISMGGNYLLDLKEGVGREIAFHIAIDDAVTAFHLGATGLLGAEANIIPCACRRFVDLFEARRFDEMADAYGRILRFARLVGRWAPSTARWVKMAMKVLDLPGGAGGLRRPYVMPPESELEALKQGLLDLHLPEIEEQARRAGLN